MDENLQILGLIASGLHILGIVSAFHAILFARSPQGSIAWALSLVMLPYITLPLYWVFGRRRFEGYINSRRAGNSAINHVAANLRQYAPEFRAELDDEHGAFLAVETLAHMPFTRGNSSRLLIDGEAAFGAIFEAMESARDYVLVQFFIIHDDRLGREFRDRLLAKLREGVRVYLLYDEIGSHSLPDAYLDGLREAGAEVSAFHSDRGRHTRWQINFRNHRKIVVVDGRRAFLGGLNIGDEYMGRDPSIGPWRDTHIQHGGPAVQCVQLCFLEDWHWATHQLPKLCWEPRAEEESDQDVLILPTGPADEFEGCGLFFAHAIQSARDRVWLASPYFVPDSAVVASLQLAGLRGADVRVLLPGKPDHLIAYLAAFSYFAECERAGVKFYRFKEGFLHQKVMLIDDEVAAVGTANLDNRSFKLNFEITSIVRDADFAGEVRAMLEADFARSRKISADDYERRPLWFKLCVRTARLFAPVL